MIHCGVLIYFQVLDGKMKDIPQTVCGRLDRAEVPSLFYVLPPKVVKGMSLMLYSPGWGWGVTKMESLQRGSWELGVRRI